MSDSVYNDLADDHDDLHRWAFGTGFTDPLAGVDTTVPEGVDPDSLAAYCLGLGDDALIYSHRLQEWLTHLPELEEETAVANVALDLLGQARLLLARAGTVTGHDEDELAFGREAHEFRNVRIVEHKDRDFAELVGRMVVLSTHRLALMENLRGCPDPVLSAIATKAVNELAYHRDYSAGWVVRLGDGTDESHRRMQAALDRLWPLVDELFAGDGGPFGIMVDRGAFDVVLDTVLATAGLTRPEAAPLAGVGGKTGRDGVHTEAFGYVLAELQSVARSLPGATW